MRYKQYGKTGKSVSILGYGGMRFRDEDSIEEAAAVVRRASELGVNYFDTAVDYCNDRSEPIMGEAFKDMPNPFYVSTKSMISADPDADAVMRRVDKCLKRMNINKINFFHMWCVLSLDQYKAVIKKGGPYDGALRAKKEGLVDHIVISTHCSGEEIETIVNDDLFEGITLGYNIINFKFRQGGLAAAYKKNMGVAVMNPLGGGTIPRNPDYFKFLCENGEDVVQAALRFIASHEEITIVLPGISTIQELEHDVEALENLTPSRRATDEIQAKIGAELDKLCTGCGYCKGCPVDIDIPKYMDAYNQYILNNDKQAALDTMRWHWNVPREKAGECIKCGQCEAKCTQHIDIMDHLEFLYKK